MTTVQDCSVGFGLESTFGTGVTPTRWWEFVGESIDWKKNVKQGEGLRVGARVARSARRVVPTAEGGGDLTVECVSKGMGLLYQAALGSGTSTLVSGATYQQVFTLADTLPSWTIQKGIPRVDGTVDSYTFLGSTCTGFTLDFDNAEVVKLKTTWDCRDLATATAYAAPSYATAPTLLSFAGGAIYTGALTAPTATALASATTQLADQVRGGSISLSHTADTGRFNLGGAGRKSKPIPQGLRAITGKLEVEYASSTFRDAILADTGMAIVLTWTGGALSSGVETLQVVIPEVRFDGETVQASGETPMQSLSFVGLDNGTASQPIWVVTRTSDAAL